MQEFPKRYTFSSWEIVCPECGYHIEQEYESDGEIKYIECPSCEIELKVECSVTVQYSASQVIGDVPCIYCEGSGKSRHSTDRDCMSCDGSGKEKQTAEYASSEKYEEWRRIKDGM